MWLKENIAPVLGVLVVVLGFAYLFAEIWFPDLKQAAAVIALIAAVVSFYYGGMDKKEPPSLKPPTNPPADAVG